MRLSEIMENDRLIRYIMDNNLLNERSRTADPKRAQDRLAFIESLRRQLDTLELEWRDKAYIARTKKGVKD
jgi:hypothetical protein